MNFLEIIEKQSYQVAVHNVLKCNSYTSKFGLLLSEEDAKQLIVLKRNILRENERFEFEGGVIEKIIYAFCDSQFIFSRNYVETLNDLVEIFYRYKNETLDMISDDELIETMKEAYENKCKGAIEFLDDTCLEAFARKVRGCDLRLKQENENDY